VNWFEVTKHMSQGYNHVETAVRFVSSVAVIKLAIKHWRKLIQIQDR